MKLGSNDISSVKIGSTDVNKIYVGSTEVWTSNSGLLADYPGAAAAYSLRLLQTTYTGDAIRVRRASDNAESDIGFVSGELDTSTLETFCSGTDGYVTTWYDQSGNGNDATQSTAAIQPKIVSAGSTILESGKPSIDFAANKSLFESSVSLTQPFTRFSVRRYTDAVTSRDVFLQQNSGSFTNLLDIGYVTKKSHFGSYIDGDAETFTNNISYLLANGVNSETKENNSTLYTGNNGTNGLSGLRIGYSNITSFFRSNVKGQEIIIWDNDQSTNRTGIETNINSQYQIYWDGSQTSLLDTYGGSAAAYSLRALSSSYTGALIKVRRASDNAEQDIYAKYDGTLNTDALESFCASTDGFVTTWYDQSGNGNDATQTTAANQPKIYDSVSGVIEENGKAGVDFDGTDDNFSVWNNTTAPTLFQDMSDAITLISVEKANVISNSGLNWFNGTTIAEIRNNTATSDTHIPFNIGYSDSKSGYGVTDNYISNSELEVSGILSISQRLTTRYINGDNLDIYINNSSAISTTFTVATGDRSLGTNVSTFSIGSRSRDGGQIDNALFDGTMQELVLWKSNLGASENGISTNINTHYNIY